MRPTTWPCPLPGGATTGEYALTFDKGRAHRLLIVPALFDEANKLRRLTVEVMRRLDGAGIDTLLPDLPGCGESLQPLEAQTVGDWRAAMTAAAAHFGATHVLAIRGGALIAAAGLPGWRYAPAKGASILRQMIRARVIASREAGLAETQESLMTAAERDGIELAGYRLSASFVEELHKLAVDSLNPLEEISQDLLGGPGLWLRAEPDDDRVQADALAAVLAVGIKA